MGLTWRDLVSSTTVVAMMVAFVAYKSGTDLPLLSSASGGRRGGTRPGRHLCRERGR